MIFSLLFIISYQRSLSDVEARYRILLPTCVQSDDKDGLTAPDSVEYVMFRSCLNDVS